MKKKLLTVLLAALFLCLLGGFGFGAVLAEDSGEPPVIDEIVEPTDNGENEPIDGAVENDDKQAIIDSLIAKLEALQSEIETYSPVYNALIGLASAVLATVAGGLFLLKKVNKMRSREAKTKEERDVYFGAYKGAELNNVSPTALADILENQTLITEQLDQIKAAAMVVWGNKDEARKILSEMPVAKSLKQTAYQLAELKKIIKDTKGAEADKIILQAEERAKEAV